MKKSRSFNYMPQQSYVCWTWLVNFSSGSDMTSQIDSQLVLTSHSIISFSDYPVFLIILLWAWFFETAHSSIWQQFGILNQKIKH